MKKILLSVLLLILSLTTFANEDISFNISNSLRLDENEGEIYLPNIKIDLLDKKTKNLNFYINIDDYFIFGNDISKVNINSFKTNLNSVKLDSKNKILKIILNEEVSGKIEIQGIKIRTYDKRIRGAKIGLDYNDDNIIDLYSINVIDLDENGRYSDNMKPLPVNNIKKIITKNDYGTYDINISWNNSPDLDIYGSFIKIYKNNSYGSIKEQFIGKLDKQEYSYTDMDLTKDSYRIEIYSKDFYYLNTDPFVIFLDKKDLIIDEKIEEKQEKVIKKEIKVREIEELKFNKSLLNYDLSEKLLKYGISEGNILKNKEIINNKYGNIIIKFGLEKKGILRGKIDKLVDKYYNLGEKNKIEILLGLKELL